MSKLADRHVTSSCLRLTKREARALRILLEGTCDEIIKSGWMNVCLHQSDLYGDKVNYAVIFKSRAGCPVCEIEQKAACDRDFIERLPKSTKTVDVGQILLGKQ